MVRKTFKVSKYRIDLWDKFQWIRENGETVSVRGEISCYEKYNYRFIIRFLTEDSPFPDPVYIVQNKVGIIYLPFKEIMPYIDVVRNEKPIYAHLNSEHPEWNCITTSKEPVGEEET